MVTRAERGRRLRELLLRDQLTGLLNHGALMAELEYAVEYGRRHGGPLAFLVFDLDRFTKSTSASGSSWATRSCSMSPTSSARSVRASDLIGRFGGGGVRHDSPRRAAPSGAAVVAAKLRRVLGDHAATTAEGVIIPLHVSVGWASSRRTAPAPASWPTRRCER